MNKENLQTFQEMIDRVMIFISRPQVEDQLLIMGVIIIAAASLHNLSWKYICQAMSHVLKGTQYYDWIHTPLTRLLLLTRAISFPVLGILLTTAAEWFLQSRQHMTGLLTQMNTIFYTILGLEIVMALLYANFKPEEIRRFRLGFHIPLLFIIVFLQLLGKFVDLPSLANLVIFSPFDNPITLGALFIATLGLYFWADAINALYTFLFNLAARFDSIDEGAVQASLTLLRYILIGFGIYYILSQLNLSSTTIAAITGGLSVGIGFALREVLSNFISGILILFERSLHPRDVIEFDGTMAVVESLKIRATTVRTIDNEELVIPNQKFLTDSFKTYTGSDKKVRISLLVLTSYENDPQLIIRLLKRAALGNPSVLETPAPEVWLQDQFHDNAVSYKLVMMIDSPLIKESVKSEVMQNIWRIFRQNNINLTFPGMELFYNLEGNVDTPNMQRQAYY